MTVLRKRARISPGIALATLLSLNSCSGSGEDVRVTLCKDLVRVLLADGETVAWTGVHNELRRLEHLVVRLEFEARGGDGGAMGARCFYRYNDVEDTALALSDPMSSYATSPYRMTLGGKEVDRTRLAQAVKQAMLKQGREFVERVQRAASGG